MKKVLVVDDAVDINLLITNYLRRNEYDVTQAFNGEEAIAALQGEDKFDAMLLDIVMPYQDGIDVVNFMTAENINVPVIAISGGGQAISGDLALKAVEPKVAAVLPKPVKPEVLMETLAKVI